MADTTIYARDSKTGITQPIKLIDNLDGTYSFGPAGGDASQTTSLAIKTKTDLILSGNKLITKTSTSNLTSGTLFNIVGSVQILSIIGRVSTAIQNSAQTVKLSAVADALTAVDLCTALTITNFAVGSVLYISGTFTDAMLGAGATAVGVVPGTQTPIIISVTTSGTLTVTFGTSGSLTGAIVWECLWIPLNSTGSITAA